MVLKTKIISWLLLITSAYAVFSQTAYKNNYAFSVISKVLKESPEGIILSNNAKNIALAYKQQEKTWFPSVQFDLSSTAELVQGDYSYIRNRGVMEGPQIIASPSASISIYQNLPGSGQLSLSAGHGLSCLVGQNSYLQQPYLQIAMSQSLSHGAFFTKDPEIEKLKIQKEFSKFETKESMFELASSFIGAVQDYNLAVLEKEYYGIMMKKAETEYQEQTQRHRLGQKTNVELFNSHMSQVQATQNFQKASQKIMQTEAILSSYNIEDIIEQSDKFRDDVLSLLNTTYGCSTEQTMQERTILSEIELEELSLKIDESKLAPSFYIQASLAPDKRKLDRYSDLSRSLRELTDSFDQWSLSGTVGVRLGLDFNSQGKAMKEISDRKIQNLNLQLDVIRDEQEKMRGLYQKWSVSFSTYCTDIEHAMEKEEEFRKDMKSLLEKNLITEAEFWSTETEYYEVRLNYYRSIWQMVQGKLNILRLSSDWMEFINQFMEG